MFHLFMKFGTKFICTSKINYVYNENASFFPYTDLFTCAFRFLIKIIGILSIDLGHKIQTYHH